MKKIVIMMMVGLSLGCAHSGKSLRYTEPRVSESAGMVFDGKSDGNTPINFRQNLELKASASGALSEKAAKYVAKLSPVVTVIDLRLESHGLVNGRPVTWSSEHDWSNVGLNDEEALIREKRYLSEIHVGAKVEKAKVRSVETEESLIRGLKQNYARLMIPESVRPTDSQVDQFLEILREIPHNSWVHFHDRSGKGRSTLFLIMYDMLNNATLADFNEIVDRNISLSHDEGFLLLPEEGDWRYPYQKDKIDFLKEFYNFAKAHPKGEGMLWNEWIKK